MTMVMRELDYGRFDMAWMPHMREPLPYFVEGPYGGGFREAHQFPVHHQPQEHMFYGGFGSGSMSPYGEPPMARIPRSVSAMPSFGGHYPEAGPFLERSGPPPLRSSSAIPAYAFVPEMPYHDSHGLARSSSSIPSFREPRESRPKHHKVGPEIELRVDMCCSKCEGKVKDALRKVPGVVDVIITDRRSSLVTVCGKVDPQAALKAVQKTKKKADFYRKQIYSDNFIDFIQSKTGRAEPEEEPDLISSYHQHAPSENGDHHAYEDNENLSSYEEYPGRDHHHDDDVDDDADRGSVHSFTIEEDDNVMKQRGGYQYGMPPSRSAFNRVAEEFYRPTVDDRPRYEPPSYSSYERTPYYERESTPSYGDYTSYRPSQGYGPSGVANPGYMKRVIRDY